MLYKSIGSMNGISVDFVKYDDNYKSQLTELNQMSPLFAEAVEGYPKVFDEQSENQSYLILENNHWLIGAVVIAPSIDKKTLEVALQFKNEILEEEYFKDTLVEIIDSLCNYFYTKEGIEVIFANSFNEEILGDLSLQKRQYSETYIADFIYYYKENMFHKIIPTLLAEMEYAEQYLLNWGVNWIEIYGGTNTNLLSDVDGSIIQDYDNHAANYNGTVFYKANSVVWDYIKSVNANREIIFDRDGTITLDKNGHGISYHADCNIVNQSFSISGEQYTFDAKGRRKDEKNTYSLAKTGDIYTISMNNIEIKYDIETGEKIYTITNPYKKYEGINASISAEAKINNENQLTTGSVEIITHKGNGKINGSYRLNISGDSIDAHFYSRKGEKYDLNNTQSLFSSVLRLPSPKDFDSSLGKAPETRIGEKSITIVNTPINQKEIRVNAIEFNMDAINNVEKGVMHFFKKISGEIPIRYLSEQLDDYFKYVDNQKEASGYQKNLVKRNSIK